MRIFQAIKYIYDKYLVLFAILSALIVAILALYGACVHMFTLWDVFMVEGHERFGMFLLCNFLYFIMMLVIAYPIFDFYWWANDRKK